MLPGEFVHVVLHGLTRRNAIVIPQRAVVQQMGRQIVCAVGRDNKVWCHAMGAPFASGWNFETRPENHSIS